MFHLTVTYIRDDDLTLIGWAAAVRGDRIAIAVDADHNRAERGAAILEALSSTEAEELVPAISFYSVAWQPPRRRSA